LWLLIELCMAVVKNEDSGRVNFPDEPGNRIFEFERHETDRKMLWMSFYADDEIHEDDKEPEDEPEICMEMTYQELGDRLYHMIDRQHSLHKLKSYRMGRKRFPLEEFLELRELWLARDIEDYPKNYSEYD